MRSRRSLDDELRDVVARWESAWRTPALVERTSITFSPRLRRSLGRCTPATGAVVLASELRRAPRQRLLETLCHEVAHVAVYMLHGRSARPHGAEWAALVRAAGYEPHTRAHRPGRSPAPNRGSTSRYRVVHTCPVCHTRRFARRVMRSWRCRECLEAGFDGALIAARIDD